jgi:hypothetical protein
MKFKLFNMFAVCALAMIVSTNARAVLCETEPPGSYPYAAEIVDHTHCNYGTSSRYYRLQGGDYIKVTDCTSCTSGAELNSVRYTTNPYGGGQCDIWYEECECPDCTNCNSDSWANYNTTHQKRTLRTCNCGTCQSTTEWRCRDGYYGNPSSSSSGCTKCGSVCGNIATTSTAGSNTSQFSCCAAAGSTGSNSNGLFTITSQVCAGDPLVLD